MNRLVRYLFVILLAGSTPSLCAQTQGVLGKRFFDNWSVGIGAGPNIFFGDLKVYQFWPVSNNMNEWMFGGTFTLTKQLSHVFAIRGQFLYSELSGTKRQYGSGYPCNEYFNGNVMEGNLNTTINFSNLFASRYHPKRKFFVYGTVGIGVSSWNSNVKQLYTDLPLRQTDSLNKWSMAMVGMAGIGAFVNLGDKVNLGIEWTLHGVNSDAVDVTTSGYHYDAYSMLSLNLTYNFNKRNPGMEPDTNRNKIYVPVYIQVPAKDEKPAEVKTPIEPEPDTTEIDSIYELDEMAELADSSEISAGIPEMGSKYRVQIFAFRTEKFTTTEVRDKYKLGDEVYLDFSGGWYRYTVGSFDLVTDAEALKTELRMQLFRDAFIVRYNNGTRVPLHGK